MCSRLGSHEKVKRAYFTPFQGHTLHVYARGRAFLSPQKTGRHTAQGGEGDRTIRPGNERTKTMNMHGEIKGDKLVLTIDIAKASLEAAKPSGSGKTLLVATSQGFARFGAVSVSLNATIPNPEFKAVAKA